MFYTFPWEIGATSHFSDCIFLKLGLSSICPTWNFQTRTQNNEDLITFMSFKFFIQLIEGYPIPFAVNYTVGNILALGASWFLCGPKRQFRNMMDERRRLTAITYLSCLVATLVVVFIPLPWALKLGTLIILLITQCASSFWYSLSYVPFGRRTVKRIAFRMLGLNERPVEGS